MRGYSENRALCRNAAVSAAPGRQDAGVTSQLVKKNRKNGVDTRALPHLPSLKLRRRPFGNESGKSDPGGGLSRSVIFLGPREKKEKMVNLYSEFEKTALAHPEKTCVILGDSKLSFEAILSASRKLAAKLREIAPGTSDSETNIGVFAPNVPGFLVGFYGTLAADKVTVPVNFLLSQSEIMTVGMHAGLRIVVAAGPLYEKAAEVAKTLPITVLRAEDFLSTDSVPDVPAVSRKDDDTAVLMYTSGTTGTPKGVELTHTNLFENCQSIRASYELDSSYTFVCVLPLFHSFGITALMLLPSMVGAPIVLVPQFQPGKFVDIFNTYPRCLFIGVAPMFRVLAHLAKTKGVKFPNLELCVAGATALPKDVKDAFEEATGVEVFQGYGLTESSPAVSVNLPGKHKPGSIGTPIHGVEFQVWGEGDKPLPTGEIGELVVRGKNVMKGYYKNPQATSETITPEGWLRTGDLASIDEDEFATIAGRKKELIICAGENVYPLEIEDVLCSHPAVAEAAVIGIPHKTKGEEPKAYVSPVAGARIEVSELRKLCRERLAPFKVPAEFEVREELPKGPSGKVLKRVLQAELSQKS